MSDQSRSKDWRDTARGAVTGALALYAAAIVTPGCGHTKKVDETARSKGSRADGPREERRAAQREAPEREATKPDATTNDRRASDEARAPEPGEAARTAQDIPIVSSPAGLYADGGVARIRRALADKGLLDGKRDGDSFDAETRAAVRKFQDQQKMPATGVPDHETVSRLGLDPDEIFKKARDREQGGR